MSEDERVREYYEKLRELFLHGSAFKSVSWSTGYVKPDPFANLRLCGWTSGDDVEFRNQYRVEFPEA